MNDTPTMLYVAGGHFTTAFEAAIIRTVGDGFNRRYIGGDFSGCIFHEWWTEHLNPDDSARDDEHDLWMMIACDEDAPGAFPVTVVHLSTLEPFFVYVCHACRNDDHERCSRRLVDVERVTMFSSGRNTWSNDPSPF